MIEVEGKGITDTGRKKVDLVDFWFQRLSMNCFLWRGEEAVYNNIDRGRDGRVFKVIWENQESMGVPSQSLSEFVFLTAEKFGKCLIFFSSWKIFDFRFPFSSNKFSSLRLWKYRDRFWIRIYCLLIFIWLFHFRKLFFFLQNTKQFRLLALKVETVKIRIDFTKTR